MRNLVICLILLISLQLYGDIPTAEQIEIAWEANQDAVTSMVQKLYVLEHAEPALHMPPLMITETTDNEIIYEYQGVLDLKIGNDQHNLWYEITLEPINITVATLPVEEGLPIWIYVVGGALLFTGGVVTGVLSTR